MATYDSLTAEEKVIVEAFERNFRGWINGLATTLIQARALDAAYDAGGGAGSIVATLDNGEDIPNTSGIAGAQPLEQNTDFAVLIAGLNAFLATYDTVATRQRMAQAAGPTAGLD
ncbi:MAG: hypothetical protein DRH08_12375 [Deltaproteobacteria bacterium]|nr:MAG: hypothetical protein DRH08_12375 [Deltaproteobacteria bacterium]